MRIRAVALTVGALLIAAGRPCLAQPPPGAASPDPDALARSRFSEGVAFAKRSVWPKAYDAFVEAWKLKRHPQIALNLGRAEIETGRYADAVLHLRYVVEELPPGDADLKLARDWLGEAEGKVARLAVTVDVAGAEVLVDGAARGTSPIADPVLLDPGKHTLEVKLGERLYTEDVEVASGASASVDVKLPAAPAATSPSFPSRTVILAGGAGLTVIAAGVGATLGGLALQKQSERDLCTQEVRRDCWVQAEADRAAMARGSAAGLAAAGLFAVGTAAYLLFAPPGPLAVAPSASADGVGLFAVGRF